MKPLACGIHCCPIFSFLFSDHHMYNVKNVYVYTSDSVETYKNYRCYEIILWAKYFYTNRERCEGLTGYLSLGCRHGGDWANT